MRLALVLALTISVCGFAAEAEAAAAAAAKPVNTICPMSGKKVDGSTTVTLKDADGKDVVVATCCEGCGAKAEKKADKAVVAAKADKKLD